MYSYTDESVKGRQSDDDDERMLSGAPGYRKFVLEAQQEVGRSIFRAVYARPWEFKGWTDFKEDNFPAKDVVIF